MLPRGIPSILFGGVIVLLWRIKGILLRPPPCRPSAVACALCKSLHDSRPTTHVLSGSDLFHLMYLLMYIPRIAARSALPLQKKGIFTALLEILRCGMDFQCYVCRIYQYSLIMQSK
jgi:hypothetical protein